jgi:monomeric sarcosine oxidase
MHVLIVGAGAAGTMAAWRVAEAGHEVTVLEQFKIDHDLGSSFGDSRIVRRVYSDRLYTGLMAESYDLWDELQRKWRNCCPAGPDSDQAELISRSGGLFFGPAGNPDVVAAEAALRTNHVPYEKLTAAQVGVRYPEFRLPPDTVALFEPSMGYARASNTINAAASLAQGCGAEFIEDKAAIHIESAVNGVRINTKGGDSYIGDRLLITAGAWTAKLLAELGIRAKMQVTRQVYLHLEQSGDASHFSPDRFPTWIDISTNMYGFPQIGKSEGVKIASHNRGILTDPDAVSRTVCEDDKANIFRYAASHFVGLSDRVLYEKVCLYTNTPDEDFIIDEVPGMPEAFVISACSGHGFKFAPLIGQIGADLMLGNPHVRDLSRFRISRLCA